MADSELKRMIARYEEELMRYADKHKPQRAADTDFSSNGGQTGGVLRQEQPARQEQQARHEPEIQQGQAARQEQFAFGEQQAPLDPARYDEEKEKMRENTERTPANSVHSDGMEPLDKGQMHTRFSFDTEEEAKPLFDTETDTERAENGDDFNFGGEEREDYEPEEDSVILPDDQFERDSELMPDDSGQNMPDNREENNWRNTDNAARSPFTGYLEVTARTGEEALPVENALIIVTSADRKGERLEYTALTDRSGTARIFDLPASNPANTETPGHANRYYLYDVIISKPGYFDMVSRGVPLFGGITSRQDFKMVPLPENLSQGDIEISNTEPQELM